MNTLIFKLEHAQTLHYRCFTPESFRIFSSTKPEKVLKLGLLEVQSEITFQMWLVCFLLCGLCRVIILFEQYHLSLPVTIPVHCDLGSTRFSSAYYS